MTGNKSARYCGRSHRPGRPFLKPKPETIKKILRHLNQGLSGVDLHFVDKTLCCLL